MTEKPIRIIKHRLRKDAHKSETRVFAQERHYTFCLEKSCTFYGKEARQGVCFSRLSRAIDRYIESKERSAEQFLKELRQGGRKLTPRQYIRYLENHIFCSWMNSEFTLDELVRLRGQNALLKAGKK